MTTATHRDNRAKVVAWAIFGIFVLGCFLPWIGSLTGPILGAWFIGTQRPRRGFLCAFVIYLIGGILSSWRNIPLAGPGSLVEFLGWALLAAAIATLPFTLHRLASPRLPGFTATLPLPLAAAAVSWVANRLQGGAAAAPALQTLCMFWLAAIVVWLWNSESRATVYVFVAGVAFAAGAGLLRHRAEASILHETPFAASGPVCLGLYLLLTGLAFTRSRRQPRWAARNEAVARLRSPISGYPLRAVHDRGGEALVSGSGERFPIRKGIPILLKPGDLTGDNGRYNQLYELIGGFYNDTQRVYGALAGLDLRDYALSYMRRLEARPGDSVLETSVGTGLNLRYLPRGVKLSGLDLSAEMLANCQANLRRWKLEADLYLCNAEQLPFADCSFDAVYHVGGINFFNDRARAIREMIRVAKPGSLILIADETEKHVKDVYEKGLGSYFKNRKQPVSAPVDLIPPEMEEVHLESLQLDLFYALTFRKPQLASGGWTAEADLARDAAGNCLVEPHALPCGLE